MGDPPRRPRPMHEAQIDARLARPQTNRRRSERLLAGRSRSSALWLTRYARRGSGSRRGRRRLGARFLGGACFLGNRPGGRRRRLCRLRSLSRGGGLRRTFRRRRGRRIRQAGRLDADELGADREHVADPAAERDDRACDRRRDLDRRLVGHHRGDDLILAHEIADLDRPFDDLGFGHALADVGHPDRARAHRQASIALTSAWPTRAGPGK